jgi:hypothetical protein
LTLLGFELPPFGRPARSQSLYRLRYPGSYCHGVLTEILQTFFTSMHATSLLILLVIMTINILQERKHGAQDGKAVYSRLEKSFLMTTVSPATGYDCAELMKL